jgi:hypothetical protein
MAMTMFEHLALLKISSMDLSLGPKMASTMVDHLLLQKASSTDLSLDL